MSFVKAQAQDFVPGELIVKLKGKSSSASATQFIGKMQGKMALKNSFPAMNMHRFSLKAGENLQAKINELKADPAVEYAEPNYIFRKVEDSLEAGEVVNGDEAHAQYQSGDTYDQSGAQNLGVDQAWQQILTLAQNPEKPIVAIIDTGVDYNHKIFQQSNAMWTNTGEIAGNNTDDDGNGYVDDIYGYDFHNRDGNPIDDDEHGTHVAGIVLGVGQNIGATTLEPARIRLMALKFLGSDGSGSTSNAIAAIYYAVNNGAQIINNSWGGPSYSQALHDALSYAYSRQVLVVSAAGNYSKNNDSTMIYPANYPIPGQISVAATNDYNNLASFSNYGPGSVHVAAPGVSIYSSVPATSMHPGNNNYRFMSGTSMAAPFVSGLAALVLREASDLTGYQVKNLLVNSASTYSSLNGKLISGARVDAYDAVMAAKSEVNTSPSQPTYKAESREVASSEESSGDSPKGCGTVSTALLFGGNKQTPTPTFAIIIAFTLLPLLVWQIVRARAGRRQQRRRFDRFLMNSAIRLNVDGRELIGHMRTISEGGLSFEANTLLEKGGILTMQIQSPDGIEQVQVQGHIVWSEKNKAYGVQFDQARDNVLSSIRQWTQKLVKVANY
ncbi:MAG: S8 family serine peptidase [Pseudobdellovibrionaceae bacterium]